MCFGKVPISLFLCIMSTNVNDGDHNLRSGNSGRGTPKCGTCLVVIGKDSSVRCDRCKFSVHASQKCSGLPPRAVKVIQEFGKAGVSYVCTGCRLSAEGHTNGNNAANNQLLEMVKGLTSTVQALQVQVDILSRVNRDTPAQPVAQNPPNRMLTNANQLAGDSDFRKLMFNEMIEMRERDKRTKSVIIRGLGDNVDSLPARFSDVVRHLFPDPNVSIRLQDIVPIKADLVRAKITSDEDRKNLLQKSKQLKDSAFASVFISRDLTLRQREEMRKRRGMRPQIQGGTQNGGRQNTDQSQDGGQRNFAPPNGGQNFAPPLGVVSGNMPLNVPPPPFPINVISAASAPPTSNNSSF